jgi:hypothetical protein
VVNFIYWTFEPRVWRGGGGSPGTHCTRGCIGPRADLDTLENKKKNVFFLGLGAELTVKRPAVCVLLHLVPSVACVCGNKKWPAAVTVATSDLAPFIFTDVTQSISGACCQNI